MTNGPLFSGSRIGPHAGLLQMFGNGSANSLAMAGANTGWCARWVALDTRDVAGIWVNFSTVTGSGQITLTIEPVDATTLKPTGTPYDASASKTFTPVVGWQFIAFDTLPTAGLTPGAIYAAMLLTTTGGTTITLRSHIATSVMHTHHPCNVLSGGSANTRSNLVEQNGYPILTWVMEDGAEEAFAGMPFATHTLFTVYGTRALAAKLTLNGPAKFDGIDVYGCSIGSRASLTGDLRLSVFTSAGAVVTGTDVTLTRYAWSTDFLQRSLFAPFAAPVQLSAGTYYVVARNTDPASLVGATFNIPYANGRSANVMPSSFIGTTTTDITAGTITWADDAATTPAIGIRLSDTVAASGGSGGGVMILSPF
ncbi:unnamed protein product [Gemmata massiliana]|uniref:Uncharacterized protein n=1 Tax=Gemmata massiliana TaxID=1210884 RepID=A0A6P2D412_9BACT|nr:hypothetical protein [Gemmata massiliana]VTR95226.1 unnamed protein product [Gemmata massiliana]